jgi:D-arginine dehydrogenase
MVGQPFRHLAEGVTSGARADVAVVGAGVIGCMIAREIVSRAPGASVVLLDRDAVGCGASRRSAGLHLPRGATDRVRRMSAYSQDYYERLLKSNPALPIYPIGMSVVASGASAGQLREIYLERARLSRVDGTPSRWVQMPKGTSTWDVDGGQYADVHALTQALACELRQRISVREGMRVAAMDCTADAAVLRLGTGDAVTARHVVLASGPWLAASAWHGLLVPLGVRVKKIVALHIEQEPSAGDRAIIFEDEDAFLLPRFDRGHWLFSYTCTEWDVDPDTVADGLSARNLDEARECLRRYSPAMADRCTAGRVFCDAYSTTKEPQVRTVDHGRRVVFAGAANGSGYRLAPAIAAEAADLLQFAPTKE